MKKFLNGCAVAFLTFFRGMFILVVGLRLAGLLADDVELERGPLTGDYLFLWFWLVGTLALAMWEMIKATEILCDAIKSKWGRGAEPTDS